MGTWITEKDLDQSFLPQRFVKFIVLYLLPFTGDKLLSVSLFIYQLQEVPFKKDCRDFLEFLIEFVRQRCYEYVCRINRDAMYS